jgi:hypothetical protein
LFLIIPFFFLFFFFKLQIDNFCHSSLMNIFCLFLQPCSVQTIAMAMASVTADAAFATWDLMGTIAQRKLAVPTSASMANARIKSVFVRKVTMVLTAPILITASQIAQIMAHAKISDACVTLGTRVLCVLLSFPALTIAPTTASVLMALVSAILVTLASIVLRIVVLIKTPNAQPERRATTHPANVTMIAMTMASVTAGVVSVAKVILVTIARLSIV